MHKKPEKRTGITIVKPCLVDNPTGNQKTTHKHKPKNLVVINIKQIERKKKRGKN